MEKKVREKRKCEGKGMCVCESVWRVREWYCGLGGVSFFSVSRARCLQIGCHKACKRLVSTLVLACMTMNANMLIQIVRSRKAFITAIVWTYESWKNEDVRLDIWNIKYHPCLSASLPFTPLRTYVFLMCGWIEHASSDALIAWILCHSWDEYKWTSWQVMLGEQGY
jgi:hypothetical protein